MSEEPDIYQIVMEIRKLRNLQSTLQKLFDLCIAKLEKQRVVQNSIIMVGCAQNF